MQTRRRKKKEGAPTHQEVGECSVCGEPQIATVHGVTCSNGHGGAPPAGKTKRAPVRSEIPEGGPARPDGFEARDGDTITVKYDGATLQIAPYSTVALDSVIYSRRLEDGEDPTEVFDQIHTYLKTKCLEKAREKLAAFADEHRKARERAGTDRG